MAEEHITLPEIVVTAPKGDAPVKGRAVQPGAGRATKESMGTCVIEVGGQRFDHMLQFQGKYSKSEGTHSGTIVLSWPGAEDFNKATVLQEGAKGTAWLDGQLFCTFRIDKRVSTGSPTTFTLALEFRGLFSQGIDGNPDHPTGQENEKTPGDICKTLMKGLDSKLIDKSNFTRKIHRFIISNGEQIERCMRRATREYGLNFIENPEGNIELLDKQAKEGGGQELRLGKNFTDWSVTRDMSMRYQETDVVANTIPTDKKYGKDAENVGAKTKDESVKQPRKVVGNADGDHDNESVKKRAEYEAKRRAAQGLSVTLKMSTWSDNNGKLWQVLNKHHVSIPVDQVDTELMIESVQFDLGPETRSATIVLVSTDEDTGGGAPVLKEKFGKDNLKTELFPQFPEDI